MFLTALDSIIKDTLDWKITFIILGIATVYGVILAFLYKFFKKNQGFSIDLPLCLLLLPVGVSAIVTISRIMGVQSAAVRTTVGFSFAGLLVLTRFRSTPKDATDLIFILFDVIAAFLVGFGYLVFSAIVMAFAVIIILVTHFSKFNVPSFKEMTLKIVVPESLNFDNLFDDILDEYTRVWNMKSIRTADFGTMFELTYIVTLKDLNKQKEFMDKLRTRNGNLTVSLSVRRFNSQFQQ